VARAVEAGTPVESLFASTAALTNKPLNSIRELTPAAEPQGLGAVLRQQWHSIDAVPPNPGEYWLAHQVERFAKEDQLVDELRSLILGH
jgi:hypothetical protein